MLYAVLLGAFLAIVVTLFEQKKYKKLDNELNESLAKLEKIEIPSPQECALDIFPLVKKIHILKWDTQSPDVTEYVKFIPRRKSYILQLWDEAENVYGKDFDEFEPLGSNSGKRGYNYFGKKLQYKYS